MIIVNRLYSIITGGYSGAPYNGFFCYNNLFGVLVDKTQTREGTCNDVYYGIKRITK